MSAPEPGSATDPPDVLLEFDGVALQLRVFDDPSGLRGQVFDGEEKLAGVQVFHTKDVDRLVATARRDAAVRRAVERRGGVVT